MPIKLTMLPVFKENLVTTNVRDSLAHVLAADSRWSIDLTQYGIDKLLYVDDIDYQKIVAVGRGVFMFAGNSKLIDNWKFAIALADNFPSAVNWSNMPTTGLAVCGVERITGRVEIDLNQTISDAYASFAGSGAAYAIKCWLHNKDATRAVATAKGSDLYSGGEVRYYSLPGGENNIGLDGPLSALNSSFMEKGYVMNISDQQKAVQPIREAVLNDAELRAVMAEVSQGNITATAPHQHMNRVLSVEEKSKLVKSMEFFFPKT